MNARAAIASVGVAMDPLDVVYKVTIGDRSPALRARAPGIIAGRRDPEHGSPMWTSKNRGRYDRSKLRYPSDLTDEEWGLVEPLIPPGKTGGGKRTVIMREVVNGLMYILSTGCQWRAIPKDLPPKSSVYDYFD